MPAVPIYRPGKVYLSEKCSMCKRTSENRFNRVAAPEVLNLFSTLILRHSICQGYQKMTRRHTTSCPLVNNPYYPAKQRLPDDRATFAPAHASASKQPAPAGLSAPRPETLGLMGLVLFLPDTTKFFPIPTGEADPADTALRSLSRNKEYRHYRGGHPHRTTHGPAALIKISR